MLMAVVFSSERSADIGALTDDLVTAEQGEVVRRKGGMKRQGWYRTDVKKHWGGGRWAKRVRRAVVASQYSSPVLLNKVSDSCDLFSSSFLCYKPDLSWFQLTQTQNPSFCCCASLPHLISAHSLPQQRSLQIYKPKEISLLLLLYFFFPVCPPDCCLMRSQALP